MQRDVLVYNKFGVEVVRRTNKTITVILPSQKTFTEDEWRDFLRDCNGDAARHFWERGPYKPGPKAA